MNKKNHLILSTLALAAALASCSTDTDNHMLDVSYPKPYTVLYADGVKDSIIFVTFDSYSIDTYDTWVKLDGENSYTFDYNSSRLYSFVRQLIFQPNTSGTTRSTVVGINSYEYQSGARFYQLGYLNVTHPSPSAKEYIVFGIPKEVTFSMADSANVLADSLVFNVNGTWNVSFEGGTAPEWIALDKSNGTGGDAKVALQLSPNKDLENDRKTTLVLSSSGVENKIELVQYKATKEQLAKMQ